MMNPWNQTNINVGIDPTQLPPTHHATALVSVLFCPIVGCAALWHANQVREAWASRDFLRARAHSIMVREKEKRGKHTHTHTFTRVFVHLFIHSFIHSFIPSFPPTATRCYLRKRSRLQSLQRISMAGSQTHPNRKSRRSQVSFDAS